MAIQVAAHEDITGGEERRERDALALTGHPPQFAATADRAEARAAAVRPPTYVVAEIPGHRMRICGRLDARSVPDVRAALHAAVDAGTGDLLVRLDGAVIADATGLGVLVGVHRRAQRLSRRLVLDDVPLPTLRLLRVTRLHRVLVLAPTGSAVSPLPLRARLPDQQAAQNSMPAPSSIPRRAS